jgi:hypothetical protein
MRTFFPYSLTKIAALLSLSVAVLCSWQILTSSAPSFSELQSKAPLFTTEEIRSISTYWNTPGRYEIGLSDTAQTEGAWVVRLTPEASTWHWRYQRTVSKAEKLPPTQREIVAPDERTKAWEKWVAAKVAYDRANAAQQAERLNADAQQRSIAFVAAQPPHPGEVPPGLSEEVGTPPAFAAVVRPRKHTVRFDDGYQIGYHDNVKVGNPRYAYVRFAEGVNSGGVAIRNWDKASLKALFARAGMTPFEQNVAIAVSQLEGGFDSINTYDTGYVSVGFIQFASLSNGGGSLGELLRYYKTSNPTNFYNDFHRFGIDVTGDGILAVVDTDNAKEIYGPEANARIISDKRLTAVFQRAGKMSDSFRVAQIQAAKKRFYPADYTVRFKLNEKEIVGKVSDIIKSEAGMATLFDRNVNTGNIRLINSVLPKLMAEKQLTTLEQLQPYEAEIIKRMKWRHDFLRDSSLTRPQS